MRSAALVLSLVAASVGPLSAQQPGTIEVGLFANTTAFDQGTTLSFGTSPGLSGMVGYFPLEHLSFEMGWGQTWTHPAAPPRVRATWRPLRFQSVYHFPAGENFFPLVGLGYVRNSYGSAVTGSDSGLSGIVGFKTYVRDRLAFRSDLHLDRIGSPFNDGATVGGSVVSSHTNWSAAAGMSYDLGQGRVPDGDRDGVPDLSDMCPDTSRGAEVGADGCRPDGDLDGVFDVDDRCPLTPPRSRVDATGCRVDSDGDEVFDQDDLCPSTPLGTTVDAQGCALDTDQDGVIDDADECALTPAGVGVDVVGCRLDGDGDGVWDEDDACPRTVAGVGVDARGCRLDTDRDGVWEEDDACPGTQPGTEVDERGCQILFEEDVVEIVLEGVTFETNSEQLTDQAKEILNDVAASLIANPEVRINIVGHTDSTGDREWNLYLSQRRAICVKAHLVEQGVAGGRMETEGFGPDQPVAPNSTPEGRAQNRRVELELIGSS